MTQKGAEGAIEWVVSNPRIKFLQGNLLFK